MNEPMVNKIKEGRILRHAKKLFLGYEVTVNTQEFYKKFPQNIYLTTEDEQRIGAFFYKPNSFDNDTQYIIFCHGKGCDRSMVSRTGDFERMAIIYNACFLIVDYRGFGDSTGDYTIEGVNYDIMAAYKFLMDSFGPVPISLVGHSLGTAVVFEYGRFAKEKGECQPFRIFCLAPFTSTIEICKDFRLVFSLFSFFIRDFERTIRNGFNYDSIKNAKAIGENIYIFHGRNDKIINIKHGKSLADVSNAYFHESDHNHITIFTDESTWKHIFKMNAKSYDFNGLGESIR